MSRSAFLGRAGASLALLGGTAALLVPARAAAASGPLADLDLALARLAVGGELLAIAFYDAALASKRLAGATARAAARARFNETEHLAAVGGILTGAGQQPSTADDFDFSFPDGTFESASSVARFGAELESALLGLHLGAVDAYQAPDLKTASARIAASEAQHLSLWSGAATGRPVGVSFPAPLDEAAASDAIGPYLQTAG